MRIYTFCCIMLNLCPCNSRSDVRRLICVGVLFLRFYSMLALFVVFLTPCCDDDDSMLEMSKSFKKMLFTKYK